ISFTRRTFGAAAALSVAAPFIRRAWADEPLQLRCSLDTAPSHPRNFAFRDFLGKLEQASGGRVATKLFEAGALFPDLQVTKALVQGQVEMASPGSWTLTGLVPDADFAALPAFYGRSIDVMHKATDGGGGKYVNEQLASKLNVQVLGPWLDLGYNQWYSTKKPLKALADLNGIKIRSPGGVLNSWRIRYFGGIANVTAWPDVPLAMSQGTFDALISTNESTNSSKLYDSGMRFSLQDQQAAAFYIPMVSNDFIGKLGPELKATMLKLWADNIAAYRANSAKSQANAKGELEKQGVTFTDVSQAELDEVRTKMAKDVDKVAEDAKMSSKLVQLVMSDVGA
ncbi:MAG TPA: TRAP transporter substrate-binding protein DctP, partial [Stellaceae bacterium]|nr:TRAP transporter substrate-binding protein DctP [Stellaceae bacterium]